MTDVERIALAMKQEFLRFDEQIELLVTEAVRLSRHINDMRRNVLGLSEQADKLAASARPPRPAERDDFLW